MLDKGKLSDDLYADARTRFSERSLIDLITAVGYYTTLALVMNAANTPASEGVRHAVVR